MSPSRPARSTPSPRSCGRLVLSLLALTILGSACSADRPELVQPTIGEGAIAPSNAPLPERAQCDTATGPGPASVILTVDAVPCTLVAAHQRLEFVNQRAEPVDLLVGPAPLPVLAGEAQVTEPAGTLLAGGPNRVLSGPETAAVVWLVEPAENPLAGAPIGLSSIGEIELGLEPAAITAATGGIPVAAGGTPCYVATLDGDPYSPLFTFRDGLLVVVQVFTPGLVTLSGIGLGATSADITAAYGERIEPRPDPAGDPARQLLVFTPSDEENQVFRLVFDLTDDRVTAIRFGATEIVADQPACGP